MARNLLHSGSKIQKGEFEFVELLKAYAKGKNLLEGTALHADILRNGLLERSPYIASSLIGMYAKCGALCKAREVLDMLPIRTIVCWNAMITGYAHHGRAHDALKCYESMQTEGLTPNEVTFSCVLKACGSIRGIEKGKLIHDEIVSRGFLEENIVLGNALIDMYAKCGMPMKAHDVFYQLPVQNVISWSALIAGYTEQRKVQEVLKCFQQMRIEGVYPDAITFTSVLKACGSTGCIGMGKQIHNEIVSVGFLENNILLGNALVDMYAKCGALEKAHTVLNGLPRRDVVTWNALISGYTNHNECNNALCCFKQMQREGLSPDVVTFSCILKACGAIGDINMGIQLHDEIVSKGLLEKNIVLGTTLVDMYAKCGLLAKAQQVHNELPVRNVVSWSALIANFVQQGEGYEAIKCYEQMLKEGTAPNEVTFTCALKACSNTGAIEKGKEIHNDIINNGMLKKSILLGTTLVDMYAKCGMLEKAQQVLNELPARNLVSWSALITGYAEQGQSGEALYCLQQMQNEGLSPNAVTILSVLNACYHSGQVDEVQTYFENMSRKYGIKPSLEHITCLVDALGCAGHLDKAMSTIKSIPCSDYPPLWLAILTACRKWGNVKLGRLAFDQAVHLDSSNPVQYFLMANIYASAGMQKDAAEIEEMMTKQPVSREPD